MFFTELAIQNVYLCIQHDMLVTLDSHYISLQCLIYLWFIQQHFNTLNAKLNPICHLLALLGAHHILHVNRIRVN